MKSLMFVLGLLLGSLRSLAASGDDVVKTQTHNTLWLTFQTPDRMPTAATAKKITREAFQNCERWRAYAKKNFSSQIKKLPACEKSDGICGSKKSCVSYWAVEVEFLTPLTLMSRARSFYGLKNGLSMNECLKWIQEQEKRESGRFFWSNCYYQEQTEEDSEVAGIVESLPDPAAEPKSRLLRHHQAQGLTTDFTIKQFTASSLEVSFPFTLRKSRGDNSDPEFRTSLTSCEEWRTRNLKRLSVQGGDIDVCRSAGSVMCTASNPPTCYLAHVAKIQWARKRALYTIDRTFLSTNDPSKGFDTCYLWLKKEEAFAPAETIHGQCSLAAYESGGGKQTYRIKGTINQTDLE